MFKIGEFSKITQVSIRMLRYYDEQHLLQPCLIDKSSGYRLYSADQIDQLNMIVLLKNMGFSVKEIKDTLDSSDINKLKQNLSRQLSKTEETIQTEQQKLKQIQSFIYDLDHPGKELNIKVLMKSLPTQNVISLRKTVKDYYCEAELWQELGRKLSNIKDLDKYKTVSIYHDLDYREENVDIEICIIADQNQIHIDDESIIYRQIPEVQMAACFMIYGPYSNISQAYKEFAYWLEQHPEYRIQGENRQICHVSPCDTDNPEEYITELQIPLSYT